MPSILGIAMLKLHSIGSQIVSRRKALGLSQSDLANKAGVSRATLEALENGRSGELWFFQGRQHFVGTRPRVETARGEPATAHSGRTLKRTRDDKGLTDTPRRQVSLDRTRDRGSAFGVLARKVPTARSFHRHHAVWLSSWDVPLASSIFRDKSPGRGVAGTAAVRFCESDWNFPMILIYSLLLAAASGAHRYTGDKEQLNEDVPFQL